MIRRLKRRLSKSTSCPDRSGAHEWDSDKAVVASSGLPFRVKYLGSAEVAHARGTELCDSVIDYFHPPTATGKKKMILTVSTEGIRVTEEESKALVFDQPIEKISFCAPNQAYPRCFSYIARDGTTQKWICHCFVTILPVTGERLSHAVGASFSLCLQKRQREARSLGVQGLQRQASATGLGGHETRRSSNASASARSVTSAPSMPSQQLEELYATVNKPRRVSSVNENIPTDQVDSGQPATTVNSLMMEPSVALTPIIYRRQQPPQQEIQQVRKPTNIDPWDMVTIPTQTSASSDPWQIQTSTPQPSVAPIPPPQQAMRRQSTNRAPRPPSGPRDVEPTTSETVSVSSDPWVPRPPGLSQRRSSKADQWLDNMITQTAVDAARRSTSPSISENASFQDVFQPTSDSDPFRPAETHEVFQSVPSAGTHDPFQPISSQYNSVSPMSNTDPFQPIDNLSQGSQLNSRKPVSKLGFNDLEPSYFFGNLSNGLATQDTSDGGLAWRPISNEPSQARYTESDEWEAVTSRHLRSQAFPDGRQDYFS